MLENKIWHPFIDFTIKGKPLPWARHRGIGKSATTPPAQKEFKKTIAQYAWAEMLSIPVRHRKPSKNIAFRMQCRVFLPFTKKLTEAGAYEGMDCLARPDLDNWIKLPLDAMNDLVWHDDSQVINFDGSGKFYSSLTRLDISIFTLEDLTR